MRFLRDIRQKRGLTQAVLSEMVGIGVNSIARYERGEVVPSIDIAHAIAKALGVTEAELLNGSSQTWELRVVYKKETEGDVVDVTGNSCCAELVVGERGMAVKLDAPYEMWMDDAKFEEIIADLRKKRETGLKSRKEGW